jgi:hypothetical protein
MDIYGSLTAGIVEVTFTKKDGTTRVMKCTLRNELIPTEHAPKGTGKVKVNTDVISVFDVENQGWRSFNCNSVTSFSY